jgi:hypothetical protein
LTQLHQVLKSKVPSKGTCCEEKVSMEVLRSGITAITPQRTRGLLNALKAAVAENTPDGQTVEEALADVFD